MKCYICKKKLNKHEAYEYRGIFSCEEHLDHATEVRDKERREIINEESAKTKVFSGLDMGASILGQANKKLLRRYIEIASKESQRLKKYENREKPRVDEGDEDG